KLTPAGVVSTGWWPTDVVVVDGGIFVTNGKGHGEKPENTEFPLSSGASQEDMHGSVQLVADAAMADLDATSKAWKAANLISSLGGASTVTCPEGAAYDFPVPRTNQEGASKL